MIQTFTLYVNSKSMNFSYEWV